MQANDQLAYHLPADRFIAFLEWKKGIKRPDLFLTALNYYTQRRAAPGKLPLLEPVVRDFHDFTHCTQTLREQHGHQQTTPVWLTCCRS